MTGRTFASVRTYDKFNFCDRISPVVLDHVARELGVPEFGHLSVRKRDIGETLAAFERTPRPVHVAVSPKDALCSRPEKVIGGAL